MSESRRMDPIEAPEAPAELIDLFREAETRAYGEDVDADYSVIFARALGVVLAESERRVRKKVAEDSSVENEVCGDERPWWFHDEKPVRCTLPKGHAAHRAAGYRATWEYLAEEDDALETPGGES